MPCQDWEDSRGNPQVVYRDRKDPQQAKELKQAEAMLCAILNTLTLSYPHTMDDIINEAETQGKVDIRKWWDKHRKDDVERLEKKLHSTFSNHEITLIKRILNSK